MADKRPSTRDFTKQHITIIEWILGALVVMLPAAAWMSQADLGDLSLYEIFPPLGLVAFGLMWTHFVMGALRRYSGIQKKKRNLYMSISMGLVLALLLLHPGLLWLALYMDGYGLPPQSYITAYSTQLGFVVLGTIALTIFLAFELKRFFGEKSWWKYVEWLQIVGMTAIFIHAIGLGNELRIDWFMLVWLFYGVSLAVSIIYSQVFYKKMEVYRAK